MTIGLSAQKFLLVFLMLPCLAWADRLTPAIQCESENFNVFKQRYELLPSTQVVMVCAEVSEQQPITLPALTLTQHTSVITIALTVVALPTRVWRLNHWFDWVKFIGQSAAKGIGQAPRIQPNHHATLGAPAGVFSSKKSWRPAQSQQMRSVTASARTRSSR